MALCPAIKIPQAPIIRTGRIFGKDYTTAEEMLAAVVNRGVGPDGPYLQIRRGRSFPKWFAAMDDVGWKYCGEDIRHVAVPILGLVVRIPSKVLRFRILENHELPGAATPA